MGISNACQSQRPRRARGRGRIATVKFIASGRGKAQCRPNSYYPYGMELDLCSGLPGEWIELPYPAPECGVFIIEGDQIGCIAITAAGRSDDPKKVKLPWRAKTQ